MRTRPFRPRAEAVERRSGRTSAAGAVAALAALALSWGCGEGSGFIVPADGGAVEADSMVVEPATYRSTEVGEAVQFTATVLDATGTIVEGAPVSWSSSEPSVATVNANGVATTFSEGATAITATSANASGSATLTVALSITPPPM